MEEFFLPPSDAMSPSNAESAHMSVALIAPKMPPLVPVNALSFMVMSAGLCSRAPIGEGRRDIISMLRTSSRVCSGVAHPSSSAQV